MVDILQAARPGTGRHGERWVCVGGGGTAAARKVASDGDVYEDMTVGRLPAEVDTVACWEYDGPAPCDGHGVALLCVGTT